jgi:hypothetical protein
MAATPAAQAISRQYQTSAAPAPEVPSPPSVDVGAVAAPDAAVPETPPAAEINSDTSQPAPAPAPNLAGGAVAPDDDVAPTRESPAPPPAESPAPMTADVPEPRDPPAPEPPDPPKISVTVKAPVSNAVLVIRVNSPGDDGPLTQVAVLDRAPTPARAKPLHHRRHARTAHAALPPAPPITPVQAAPPVAAPVLATGPPAASTGGERTGSSRHGRRAPPREPPEQGSLRMPAGAEGLASAAAGGGGGGGAGAALAIVIGLLSILIPSGLRGLRLAADGPPAEPPGSVLERPG